MRAISAGSSARASPRSSSSRASSTAHAARSGGRLRAGAPGDRRVQAPDAEAPLPPSQNRCRPADRRDRRTAGPVYRSRRRAVCVRQAPRLANRAAPAPPDPATSHSTFAQRPSLSSSRAVVRVRAGGRRLHRDWENASRRSPQAHRQNGHHRCCEARKIASRARLLKQRQRAHRRHRDATDLEVAGEAQACGQALHVLKGAFAGTALDAEGQVAAQKAARLRPRPTACRRAP